MGAQPVWFGPVKRPLFGWLHAPGDARARAGAVICPSLTREHTQSHYALRVLAEQLSERGVLALRFDYDGTGDSAGGPDDAGRVAAWRSSVAAAVRLVRGTGVPRLVLVGLRIGATLAAQAAAEDGDVDQLVLWDPELSGGTFLREQKALASLTLGLRQTLPDGSLDAPGATFRPETVAELRALRMDRLSAPLARRVLVLTRPASARDRPKMEGFGAEPVEFADAAGQEALLDAAPPFQKLPHETLQHIAGWVARGASADAVAVDLPEPAGATALGKDGAGRPLLERPHRVAPAGLFGMLTEVPGTPEGPVAVFLSVANEPHTGPSRMWVDLARRWAPLGIRSLRVDLSGIGDSPVRTEGQEVFVARAPEAFADVADVVAAARALGSGEVVLVGICAAGYQAVDSALRLRPAGVVAVNPRLAFVPEEYRRGQPLDPRRTVAIPRKAVATALRETAPGTMVRKHFPGLRRKVWHWTRPGRPLAPLARLSTAAGWKLRFLAHPRRRPSSWLPALVCGGTDVLLVANERDARPIRFGASARLLSRLARSGRFRFEYLPQLEHALLLSADRQLVGDMLTRHMVEKFGSLGTAARPAAGKVGSLAAGAPSDRVGADGEEGAEASGRGLRERAWSRRSGQRHATA